jgi:hypothetical protein
MPPAQFEPAIPAIDGRQTLALDRSATGIGQLKAYEMCCGFWYREAFHSGRPTNVLWEYDTNFSLKMEAADSSKTLPITYQTRRCHEMGNIEMDRDF